MSIHTGSATAGALTTFISNEKTPLLKITEASIGVPLPPSDVRLLKPNTVPEFPFSTRNSTTSEFVSSSVTIAGVEPPQQSQGANTGVSPSLESKIVNDGNV